jgi:hypothetical protein
VVFSRTLPRRHSATFDRWLPALLLATSLVLQGCPVTPLLGSKSPAGNDPGPPTVFDPTMLDRG